MDIRDIQIRSLNIPETPAWMTTSPPQAIPIYPPVTNQVGVPIVDIPGCVEAHPQDKGTNDSLKSDDERGVQTYCDAGVPSFNPIDYQPDKLKYQQETPVPPIRPPETPETPTPKTDAKTPRVECPTEAQRLKEPVGTLTDGGTKKITGYRQVGKECIPIKETLAIPDQVLKAIPSAGAVTTTASIAVVATTSALLAKPLADLLLKVVKPTVKKVIKKIAAIRGKQAPIESLRERRGQQRIRNKAIRILKGRA